MSRWNRLEQHTDFMLVPGGMIVKHVNLPYSESDPPTVTMVFVPCSKDEIRMWVGGVEDLLERIG